MQTEHDNMPNPSRPGGALRTPTRAVSRRVARGIVWPLLALLLASCREQSVTAYRVPKDPAAPAPASNANPHASMAPALPEPSTNSPAPAGMADTAVATASGPGLTWMAPAHWQSKPASAMRKGSYALAGAGGASAELSITAFPGDVGGEIANVNRWRGQLQLAPLPESDVAAALTRLNYNGLKIAFIELANPSAATPTRLLGAMVAHEGATWFFKLLGSDSLVAKEKEPFLEFLKTIKPAPAAAKS